MGGGGGNTGPTQQQLELQTQQATQTAQLNLEENEQRKTILNAMQGMRVFRESALSRAVAGNTAGSATPVGGPSPTQSRAKLIAPRQQSLLDVTAAGSGATAAGGAGGSGGVGVGGGVRGGGSGRGPIP